MFLIGFELLPEGKLEIISIISFWVKNSQSAYIKKRRIERHVSIEEIVTPDYADYADYVDYVPTCEEGTRRILLTVKDKHLNCVSFKQRMFRLLHAFRHLSGHHLAHFDQIHPKREDEIFIEIVLQLWPFIYIYIYIYIYILYIYIYFFCPLACS